MVTTQSRFVLPPVLRRHGLDVLCVLAAAVATRAPVPQNSTADFPATRVWARAAVAGGRALANEIRGEILDTAREREDLDA